MLASLMILMVLCFLGMQSPDCSCKGSSESVLPGGWADLSSQTGRTSEEPLQFLLFLFIYLRLAVLGGCCCEGFSLVARIKATL